MEWLLIAVVIIAIVLFMQYKKQKNLVESKKDSKIDNISIPDKMPVPDKIISYERKPLLTRYESQIFLRLFPLYKEHGYLVYPQVNLASVIRKRGDFKFQNELYRNLDFGIFDREYNVVVLIEINDITHSTPQRASRDIKIRNICEQANIPLITFYASKPNTSEYMIKRIMEIISKPTNGMSSYAEEKSTEQHM